MYMRFNRRKGWATRIPNKRRDPAFNMLQFSLKIISVTFFAVLELPVFEELTWRYFPPSLSISLDLV